MIEKPFQKSASTLEFIYKKIIGTLKKILGVILIIVGIIGLFLPILQGILLIIAGLLLIGVKKETIGKWVNKSKDRFKKFFRK